MNFILYIIKHYGMICVDFNSLFLCMYAYLCVCVCVSMWRQREGMNNIISNYNEIDNILTHPLAKLTSHDDTTNDPLNLSDTDIYFYHVTFSS
jgi:hypothetical protein